jgi:hypothetical protein
MNNKIKINNYLKKNMSMNIIDYVVKNCPNGGIIILEEIDLMCKIFRKRSESNKQHMTETEAMDSLDTYLTLESVLNVFPNKKEWNDDLKSNIDSVRT